jgi:His-Xaa-Ser system radical SAM maturase HxsB
LTSISAAVSSTKFKKLEEYTEKNKSGYQLLPFRFIRLDVSRYVLTNEVGEFIVIADQLLQPIIAGEIEQESELFHSLKSKHFILDEDSNCALDLLALKVRSKYGRIADFTSLHMFVVSLRCDHSCPYCQVSRQSEDRVAFDMSTETAAKCLDFTFRSPSHNIKIEFQGGEPLLNFELIQWIVLEAKRRNLEHQKNLQFVITTNLSQLNDEILAFAADNKMLFSTSLDGPEPLHVANRPRPGGDSYKKTVDGIQRIRASYGPDNVSALMTTTEASLPLVKEIIDEYVTQGFNSIFLRPLSPYGFAMKTKWFNAYDTERWLKFYFEGLEYILELNKRGLAFRESYAGIILSKMFSPLGTPYVDLQSPAGMGISAIAFNYDGEVYASDESRMLAEMNDKTFRLGNIHDDSYEDIMLSDNLLNALELSITESVPACNDCGFQPYCGSDPTYHHATQKDTIGHKMFSGFCKRNMTVMRKLITLLTDDPEAREILLGWIKI